MDTNPSQASPLTVVMGEPSHTGKSATRMLDGSSPGSVIWLRP